jgi:hypothetical protein
MSGSDEIQLLEKNGYTVQILENLDDAGKVSQKEVGTDNRYIRKSKPQPHRSTSDTSSVTLDNSTISYLNVDEVEAALLVASSAPYTTITKLIPLPELT